MRYLLRNKTSYEHLAKKFEREVLTCVGRDGSEMAVWLHTVKPRFNGQMRTNDSPLLEKVR